MHCQVCQRQTPTARVTLMQNIGMLVARQSKTLSGDMCRACGMQHFKSMTLTTLFLGWWGIISFFVTPIFLIGNLIAWSSLRALPSGDAQGGDGGGGEHIPP